MIACSLASSAKRPTRPARPQIITPAGLFERLPARVAPVGRLQFEGPLTSCEASLRSFHIPWQVVGRWRDQPNWPPTLAPLDSIRPNPSLFGVPAPTTQLGRGDVKFHAALGPVR